MLCCSDRAASHIVRQCRGELQPHNWHVRALIIGIVRASDYFFFKSPRDDASHTNGNNSSEHFIQWAVTFSADEQSCFSPSSYPSYFLVSPYGQVPFSMLTTVEELVDTGQEMRKDILLLITDDSPLLQTFPPSGWFVPANGLFLPLHITLP